MNTLPKYDELFLTVLSVMGDGQEKSIPEIASKTISLLSIPQGLLEERLSSGSQRVIDNRIGWARTYLHKAGLLQRTRRGIYQITNDGTELLRSHPHDLTLKDLEKRDELREWRKRSSSETVHGERETEEDLSLYTPEEQVEKSIESIGSQLQEEVLERIKQLSPEGFEQLVLHLLVGMGYGGSMADVQGVAKGADGGIDGVVNQDHLGLDRIYIQAKRWEGAVGRPVIQAFVGALAGVGASKGVIMTTSSFAGPAQGYVRTLTDRRIVLVDGKKMASLMMKHQIGTSIKETYVIQRIDEDFFIDLEQ